ncbi:MAG: ferrous iron transport protein A [Christensenellales bacterium]
MEITNRKNVFPLDSGEEGKVYEINSILAPIKIKRRLLELGFVDCCVKILKKSVKNGVFLLEIRHYVLALKRKEVACIFVQKRGQTCE